ncbi:DNA alkylation repair protein [bacterium]|nr:DNA alkylation repair protein [bacterium]MBU1650957.1 DNA alkylation repair protein [bacterium]
MDPNDILTKLQPLADAAYAASIDHFAPQSPTEEGGAWTSVGVRVPVLREFEKPLFKQLQSADDYQMMLEFTDEAFKRRIRELAVIGIEGLVKLKRYWNRDVLSYIPKWIPQLSGWETTDLLCGGLFGNMIVQGVMTIENLIEYKNYPSVWGRRAVIVAMILPLRKGAGDIDRCLEILADYASSREKMIYKAVSWALREASKKYPDRVHAFIDKHAAVLHGSVLREVRNKLDTGKKNPNK